MTAAETAVGDGVSIRDDARDGPRAGLQTRRPRRLPRGQRGRKVTERITASMVVGVVLALLAFVVVAAVLRDRREMTAGLVPIELIPAGTAITAEMVERVEFPASVPFADSLVRPEALDGGLVAGRVLEPGEPLVRSGVGQITGRQAGRVMAIPLESWGDVGGELVVGDQIDVIDTSGSPAYVIEGAAVVARAAGDGSGGSLSGSTRLWVSIEVTAQEALVVAGVIEHGRFVVVRSTGAEPVPRDLGVDPPGVGDGTAAGGG